MGANIFQRFQKRLKLRNLQQ